MPLTPLNKRQHPDFVSKGKKPVGPVEIDWSNPICRKLAAVYMPLNGQLIDLVKPSRSVTVTGTPSFSADVDGYHAFFDGSTYYEFSDPSVTASPLTAIAIFKTTDLTNFDTIWSAGDNSSDEFVIGPAANVGGDPFYTHVRRSGGTLSAFGGTITSDKKEFGAGVIDSNDVIETYFNGLSVDTTANTNIPTVTIERVGARSVSGAPNKFGGKLYFLPIWNRELSAAEIYSLNSDPYQILKPAVDVTAFYGAGGGATYDVSTAFGLTLTQVTSSTANSLAQTNMSTEVGAVDGGLSNALASSNLQSLLGFNADGIVAFDVTTIFSSSMGVSTSAIAQGSGLVNLTSNVDMSVQALSQAIANTLMTTNQDMLNAVLGQIVNVSANMGVSVDTSASSTMVIQGDILLSASVYDAFEANAQSNANMSLTVQTALQVLAQAQALGNINLGQVVSVTTTGSAVIVGLITPDERVYTIEIDIRKFVIAKDDRSFKL